MSRSRLMFVAIFAPLAVAAFAACGSSSGTGGSSSSTSTSTSSSTSTSGSATTSSSSSSSTTSSSSGSTGTGGAMACEEGCASSSPAGYQAFQKYELSECACKGIPDGGTAMDGGASYPCESVCGAECAGTMALSTTSPCGTCLLGQAAETTSSPCTVKAGLTDCMNDSTCLPFLTCELGCAQ